MLLGLLTLLLCAPAAQPPEARATRLEASATTDFPLSVGARVTTQLGPRIRLGAGVGYVPGPYLDAINGFVVSVGGYNQDTADLIKSCLEDSLVARVDLGWRPWRQRGFYVDLGYRYVALGGGATGETLLKAATGYDPPNIDGAGDSRLYDVAARVHLASLELGWSWILTERLTAQAGLGFVTTLDSQTTVEGAFRVPSAGTFGGEFSAEAERLRSFESESEDFIDVNLEKYFHSPLILLGLGYQV